MRLRILGLVSAGATVAALALATPTSAATGQILGAGGPHAVAGSYLVVMKDGVTASAAGLAAKYGASVGHTYSHALRGFEARVSEAGAKRLAADPAVKYVEQNSIVWGDATQSPVPSWGLDRIDARSGLDNSYTYPNTAANVHVYSVDTGVASHTDFGGRLSTTDGFDAIDGALPAADCNGHGTHTSSTAGGTTFGVAKGVTIVPVRVLDCNGSGTFAQVIAGGDWVTGHAIKPAVANMSLGGGATAALDTAVTNSINSGVVYSVSAGNSNANACQQSPARVPAAITVGATDINDNRASFSNKGRCLDLFAPGVAITGAWLDDGTNTISGTSMAAPHVTGAAAILLSVHPTWTPSQVRNQIVADATRGVGNRGGGSPNLLLFIDQTPETP